MFIVKFYNAQNEDSKLNTDKINYSYLLITLGLVLIKQHTWCTLHVNDNSINDSYHITMLIAEGWIWEL